MCNCHQFGKILKAVDAFKLSRVAKVAEDTDSKTNEKIMSIETPSGILHVTTGWLKKKHPKRVVFF